MKKIPMGRTIQRRMTTGTPDTRANRVKNRVIRKAEEIDLSRG